VLTAIELDYEKAIQTHKVDDVFPQGMLLPEFETLQLASAQCAPEDSLSICGP
jgi:hypothetical protein